MKQIHNHPSQQDLRSGEYFHCKRYATVKICSSTTAAAAGRYERGSKINKMSHVLNLRHAVESLAALK